ncbi:MAG: DnaD domain protein, partial [Oscillospiraceae bacterium]|nr:DnaD domain protein [Oscillospiraceae bacterium]
LSLVYHASPKDVRFIMVDPKRLELSIYEGIPHLLLPVVTDPKKAGLALAWALREMDRRYQLMSDKQVRNIDGYNQKIAQELEQRPASPVEEVSLPPDELPEYTSAEIDACTKKDSGFKAVLDATRQILGKQLTRHDMSRMLGIYNHLGLSAEVIYVLLHYCADLYRGPEGAARKPTIRAIEREAFLWANKELYSPEEAEAYVETQKQLHSRLGDIKAALEIYDRKLIPSEEAYFTAWLEMGFSTDVIRLAYERTVKNTGKRALAYMNTILTKWNEAGLHTLQEIEKQDPSSGRKPHGKPGKPDRVFVPTEFD